MCFDRASLVIVLSVLVCRMNAIEHCRLSPPHDWWATSFDAAHVFQQLMDSSAQSRNLERIDVTLNGSSQTKAAHARTPHVRTRRHLGIPVQRINAWSDQSFRSAWRHGFFGHVRFPHVHRPLDASLRYTSAIDAKPNLGKLLWRHGPDARISRDTLIWIHNLADHHR
jgi:hypothetical protein